MLSVRRQRGAEGRMVSGHEIAARLSRGSKQGLPDSPLPTGTLVLNCDYRVSDRD
jgi:hypothetical protein